MSARPTRLAERRTEKDFRETIRILRVAEMHRKGASDIHIAMTLDLTMAEVDDALSVRWADLRARTKRHNLSSPLFP